MRIVENELRINSGAIQSYSNDAELAMMWNWEIPMTWSMGSIINSGTKKMSNLKKIFFPTSFFFEFFKI